MIWWILITTCVAGGACLFTGWRLGDEGLRNWGLVLMRAAVGVVGIGLLVKG